MNSRNSGYVGVLFASFLALLWMIWSGLTVMLPDNADEGCSCPKRFFVIGARGMSEMAPENTLPAFELAAETTGYLQLDLAMTKDKQLITFYDEYVDRTTNGHGVVCLMSLKEIQALDAGEWFGKKYIGVKVPTLSQMFAALGNRSRYLINIRSHESCLDREQLVFSAVRIIKQFGLQPKVVFAVEEKNTAHDLKKLLPSSMVLANINVLYTLAPLTTMWEFVEACGADGVAAHYLMPLLKSTLLSEAHERKQKVFIHTVDSMYVSRWLECLGVDAIISNSPDKLLQVSKCPITGASSDFEPRRSEEPDEPTSLSLSPPMLTAAVAAWRT